MELSFSSDDDFQVFASFYEGIAAAAGVDDGIAEPELASDTSGESHSKYKLIVSVDREKLGLLLGKRKSNLMRIEAKFHVKVWVSRGDDTGQMAEVSLYGRRNLCKQAANYMLQVLNPSLVEFSIQRWHSKLVIGPKGAVARAMSSAFGVRIVVDDYTHPNSKFATVKLTGPLASCKAAQTAINIFIAENSMRY